MAHKLELVEHQCLELRAARRMKQDRTEGGSLQQDTCDTCKQRLLGRCEGNQLEGKRVLYVGGLHKMVAHYRQMSEGREERGEEWERGKED